VDGVVLQAMYIEFSTTIFVLLFIHTGWLESLPCVGKDDRLEECNVTEKGEEIDDEGFITVWTKRAKQESKRSKKVNVISDLKSKKCKVVSRVILLKQTSY
jgi:hypothetical protein